MNRCWQGAGWLVLGFTLSGSAEAADAGPAAPLPILAETTLPRHKWALSANVQFGYYEVPAGFDGEHDPYPFGPQTTESGLVWGGNFFLPDISVGLTDRLQLGVTSPGVAYRFGDRGGVELIPSIQTLVGGGYSTLQGVLLSFDPRVALDVRSWIGQRTHLTLGGALGTRIRHRGGTTCPSWVVDPALCAPYTEAFDRLWLTGNAAFVHTFAQTVTVALGGYASYRFMPSDSTQNSVVLGFGGTVRSGVWSSPLLRWHATSFFAVDGYAGYARDLTTQASTVLGGGGVSFDW